MPSNYLTLSIVPSVFAVCRLDPASPLPSWATPDGFMAIVRTAEELSIVCAEQAVPAGVICQRGWRGLKVAGPLDFALTGVLASLAGPLAEAGVSIFAISTYDTDYLFVRGEQFDIAIATLRRAEFAIA
jgi:uncharacterized protein